MLFGLFVILVSFQRFKFDVLFLAATKQLYEWPPVLPSVGLFVFYTFFTMFPSSYHHEKNLSPMTEVMSMQKVKVTGRKSR